MHWRQTGTKYGGSALQKAEGNARNRSRIERIATSVRCLNPSRNYITNRFLRIDIGMLKPVIQPTENLTLPDLSKTLHATISGRVTFENQSLPVLLYDRLLYA